MADEKEMPARERRGDEDVKPSGGRRGKIALLGLVGGIMLLEGVAIFTATRFLGGPAQVEATVPGLETAGGEGGAAPAANDKEVVVASFRAMNDRSGRNVIYDLKVYARVGGATADKIQKVFEEKKASVEDRMAKVIRAADPQFFKEPGLETLRRQIKHEVEAAIGETEAIQEILIPSLMWYSADS